MAFNLLHSPLAATAGVLVALGLLAIPLRHLTSHRPPPAPPVTPLQPAHPDLTPALLRLKLLAPARSIRVTTETGAVLLNLSNLAAGESEHDASLPLRDGNGDLNLLLEADLGDSPTDTAVFLTVMPDARVGQTRYAIGSGSLREPLRFAWHQP